ncbi:MAG TPA: 4-hydroxy-tetrahydrodipicolinate reductase [Candidatus Syntrophosphaera sp.]|nr:4-hydroxy-tetrahydrodipicolinate reductase [Candidatus Syntrophosphaera sp.]HRT60131.1 4-hydroxy-tetrahydrodipicolinate reductase [Candidatus Syntrophosphaera sp.]
MLNITLIGYGKMGHMIAGLAEEHGCKVCSIIDPGQEGCEKEIRPEILADVCIDFSQPDMALANIRQVAVAGKHMVVGTTGWHRHLDEVKELAERHGIGILWGANFSIGMNLFTRVIQYATSICDKFPMYDVCGWEMHHNQKADSPSGTAIQLAEAILEESGVKDQAVYDKLDRRILKNELHFASLRGGAMPGTHSVIFDCETDSLELTHRVRSRACFAAGALQAAQWISLRKGFYSFNQMMEDLLC